jgi:hypothetical protein
VKRRDPTRGGAALFLSCALLVSCATGVGVWLYLKNRFAHANVVEASAPPVRPTPAPDMPEVPAAVPEPVPEPVVEPVPAVTPEPMPDPNAVPEELTPEQIEATIAAARSRFAGCALEGRVTLTLKIRPSGRVEQVLVEGTDSDEMRTCLVSATKRIKFAKSVKGLTARYSLVGS